ANLDNASGGRIDLGIGAGWKQPEYEAYGYPFPSTKTRILQLREALQIINLLWTKERPSFEGEFYSIKETMFLPKPVQHPRVPIWVGTQKLKAPMMEETATRFADGLDYETKSADDLAQKKERMEIMCEKVGRDFEDLKWSAGIMVAVIGEDNDDFENRKRDVVKQEWPHKFFTEDLREKMIEAGCKQDLAGPPESVVERLLQYKELVDVVNIGLPFVGDVLKNGLDAIRILKDYIAPRL
ncbi:MAG: LLM class flavin-dependent oxidoreductase, partial [Candidatus Thorarchaeota archaeon]|nr:LLM class flavin-dependent oxidoreductase [Candidatus Thorarchaeota archaeon]